MRLAGSVAAAFLLLVAGAPSEAQDAEAALGLVRSCLELSEGRAAQAACVGAYARDCAAASPEGETTVGMTMCAATETEAWDRLLNETWGDLVVLARRRAVLSEEAGETPVNDEEMLLEAQRAWISFRDADCAQETAIWGMGSMRQIAGAYCMMERTATRTLELRAKRAAMQVD